MMGWLLIFLRISGRFIEIFQRNLYSHKNIKTEIHIEIRFNIILNYSAVSALSVISTQIVFVLLLPEGAI